MRRGTRRKGCGRKEKEGTGKKHEGKRKKEEGVETLKKTVDISAPLG
jgi:hypothetical protein